MRVERVAATGQVQKIASAAKVTSASPVWRTSG